MRKRARTHVRKVGASITPDFCRSRKTPTNLGFTRLDIRDTFQKVLSQVANVANNNIGGTTWEIFRAVNGKSQ